MDILDKLNEFKYIVIPTQNVSGLLWYDDNMDLSIKNRDQGNDIMYLCNLDKDEENGK